MSSPFFVDRWRAFGQLADDFQERAADVARPLVRELSDHSSHSYLRFLGLDNLAAELQASS